MAGKPAFMFYPADWRNNANLRRCSAAARGYWIDVMGLLHDSEEYGVLRWPLEDIARAAGVPMKEIQELVSKQVLKGADDGSVGYIYTPSHAGQTGDPMTLVKTDGGPCWFGSRMVRDEWVRKQRGKATRFNQNNQPLPSPKKAPSHSPKPPPKPSPKSSPKPPFGDGLGDGSGDGPSFAFAFTEKAKASEPNGSGEEPPGEGLPADPIWGAGLAFLIRKGMTAKQARPLLGKVRQACGDLRAAALLAEAEAQDITDPAAWLMAAAAKGKRGVPAALPVDDRSDDEIEAANLAALAQLQALSGGIAH